MHVLATQLFLETYATSGIREALAREVTSHFSLEACDRLLVKPGSRVLLAEIDGHCRVRRTTAGRRGRAGRQWPSR